MTREWKVGAPWVYWRQEIVARRPDPSGSWL